MSVTIRAATPADADTIFRFIVELAVYEREPEAVQTSAAELRGQLEQVSPPFECLIAEHDGAPVGFALFFANYSTWRGRPGIYLEDLFVSPEARGHGAGKALLTALARLTVARGGARLEWSVLDWNAPAIDFYHALGAFEMSGWHVYRLTDEALRAAASAGPEIAGA